MQTLYVTNKWEKPITFNYEFKPYTFPVGETVEAPEDAVCHIFGHGDPNKENYIPEGLKILSKFEISDRPPVKNHLLSPVVERVPLPSKKVGGKVNSEHDG